MIEEIRLATTDEVVAELRKRSTFVMVSHVKPDGDTLGAALALGIALKAIGKRVYYFQQDAVPRNLQFLPDTEFVSRDLPADLPADALFVFGDMSNAARAGEYLPPVERKNILNIDHHLGNERFGALNYIIDSEASTGSCVLLLLQAMGLAISAPVATCLLTCIMTDTGGFMHNNTTPNVLRTGAMLMEAGADKYEITEQIFANKRFAAQRLLGLALSAAVVEENGRYCWTYVDEAMLGNAGGDGEDTEEIVNHLRAVEGVEVAALFKDFDGAVRVSLRSSGRINVQAVAATLGGGGHFMASGLTYPGDRQAAIAGVRAALKKAGL
ncbi:MAG TPA: bifunctional oligoribonuclease/PAP phosphatase NrnA [Candidatus Binatia bacterium]|nr:bifunctional oligoribonuclease/PAP phosphatase NrnA [Candidatus Binatia bacterium]